MISKEIKHIYIMVLKENHKLLPRRMKSFGRPYIKIDIKARKFWEGVISTVYLPLD